MMKRLLDDVKEAFQDGLFVARLTDGKFNTVWLDYSIEATANKALKGSGGIIGLTLKGATLAHWFLARPVTATYSSAFKDLLAHNQHSHKDGSEGTGLNKAENRWNSDVTRKTHLFEGTFIDPFDLNDPPPNLTNIATGMVAKSAVEDSLTQTLDKGDQMATNFVNEQLLSDDSENLPKKSFFDPLPRSNIKTMSEMNKALKVRAISRLEYLA